MKVLLINCPCDDSVFSKKRGYYAPPIGLLNIAAYIREAGEAVRIYDFVTDNEDFFDVLSAFNPDIIGVTCVTPSVPYVLDLCRKIKAGRKDIPIVVGGHHATHCPSDFLRSGVVDYIVRGEGEETFLDLINTISAKSLLNSVKGINFLGDDGELITTPDRECFKNLDILPREAFDLLQNGESYFTHKKPWDPFFGRRYLVFSISRGCPYQCAYCGCSGSYRVCSPERIIDDISYYYKTYKINSFSLIDNVFTLSKKRVYEFCERMISSGYHKKVSWMISTRLDLVDNDLLKGMRDAGCEWIFYGVDSGVQKLLDGINKKITVEQMLGGIKMTKRSGIKIAATFILGLPGETFFDSLKTVLFALRLPVDLVSFGLATPFPGTALWDIAGGEVKIHNEGDWKNFMRVAGLKNYSLPYIPEGRKEWELKLILKLAQILSFLKIVVCSSFKKIVFKFKTLRMKNAMQEMCSF